MNANPSSSPLEGEDSVGLAACCLATRGEGVAVHRISRAESALTLHPLRLIRFAHKSRSLSLKGRGVFGVIK